MRPVLPLFLIFGSSVGFYSIPMVRRMSSAAAFGSMAGSQLVRAVSAMPAPQQCGSTQRLSTSMSAAEFVDKEVEANNVVIFSKSYCPFCARTKTLFDALNVEHTIYELDQRDDGPEIQAALASKTGQTTVPNVFVKGTHVGGNDAVQAANQSGALKQLLED